MESMPKVVKDYSKYIELTNLKSPNSKEIRKFVETANQKGYFGVCLQPGDLPVAAKYRNPDLKLITVMGFPPIHTFKYFADGKNKRIQLALGLYKEEDIDSIKSLIDSGLADELDLVFPIYWYMRGQFTRIHKFLKGIKDRYQRPVKVICELGTIFNKTVPLYEIIDLLKQSGVDYFKTNTGLIKQDFDKGLLPAILYTQMMMNDMGVTMDIKASGGIRTEKQIKTLIQLGVKRIGTSAIQKDNPAEASAKVGEEEKNDK